MDAIVHLQRALGLVVLLASMVSAAPLSRTVDLVAWTQDIIAQVVTQEETAEATTFVAPRRRELRRFRGALRAVLKARWHDAHHAAAQIDYTVLRLRDSGRHGEVLDALMPDVGNADGRSYFIVRPLHSVRRHLIIEVPHPHHDEHTLRLGSQLFRELGARGLAFASFPRCANLTEPSPCDGRTRACSTGPQAFRKSDLAHTDQSFFHTFHRVLDRAPPAPPIFLQIHGFQAGPHDPAFVVSDGTNIDHSSPRYITNALARELETRLATAGLQQRGYSCNRRGDPDRLCGTTNIQGRYTNGARGDYCSTKAHAASGRFIHLELSMALRHPDNPQYTQVITEALRAVLPPHSGFHAR